METLEPLWIRHWSCIIVASQDHQGLTRDISGLMEGMWGGSWRGGGMSRVSIHLCSNVGQALL